MTPVYQTNFCSYKKQIISVVGDGKDKSIDVWYLMVSADAKSEDGDDFTSFPQALWFQKLSRKRLRKLFLHRNWFQNRTLILLQTLFGKSIFP